MPLENHTSLATYLISWSKFPAAMWIVCGREDCVWNMITQKNWYISHFPLWCVPGNISYSCNKLVSWDCLQIIIFHTFQNRLTYMCVGLHVYSSDRRVQNINSDIHVRLLTFYIAWFQKQHTYHTCVHYFIFYLETDIFLVM